MSHPPLVSSLVDVLVNGDEVGTPEDSPLPLRKVSVVLKNILFSTRNLKCFGAGSFKRKKVRHLQLVHKSWVQCINFKLQKLSGHRTLQ